MTTAFRVLVTMEVDAARGAEFERVWSEVAAAIAAEPGNQGQELLRDTGQVTIYHVVTDWTDEPAFRRFETSEAHRGHRRRLDPYRGTVRMTTMRFVQRVPAVPAVALHTS